ncbi:hypothetical protein AWB71_05216 [Caballeronia peredens]|nr:hypothetical protein AWB71_05216 [Caballeronia peredens]
MNRLKALVALSLIASAGVAANACAWSRVGVWVGGPVYYPYPVAPVPYYYYPPPPVVVAPQAPVTYVEQGQPATVSPGQPDGNWYYCDASRAYYPYVRTCPAGWRPVPAQPPPPSN